MKDGRFHSVLRRMAGGARSRREPVPAARHLTLALSRAAQALMALPLAVRAADDRVQSLAEVIEGLPDRALFALAEGPDETLGLVALSPEIVAGLIEMQTLGQVGAAAVVPRRPTRTDAAMSAGFLDRAFRELEAAAAQLPWAQGFHYASHIEDPRPLGLLLEDRSYRTFRLEVVLGAGAERAGQVFLALPLPASAGELPAAAGPAEAAVACADGPAEWSHRLAEAASAAAVALPAVLERRTMPLAELLALKSGAVLTLPADALARIELCGLDGRRIATGRLGQAQGRRAVRLVQVDGGADPLPAADPAAPPVRPSAAAVAAPAPPAADAGTGERRALSA